MTYTWVYARGLDRMEVRRGTTPVSTHLEVIGQQTEPRAFDFEDHAEAVTFHLGFEHALMLSGWTFAEFKPERRAGSDRRSVRRSGDRRCPISLAWSQSAALRREREDR